MRTIYRLLYSFLGSLLLLVFVITLFSLTAEYSTATVSETIDDTTTTTVTFALSVSGFFYGVSNFNVIQVIRVVTDTSGATYDPITGTVSGVTMDYQKDDPIFVAPEVSLHKIIAIAMILLVIGMMLCLMGKKSKVGSLLGLIALIAGTIMYFVTMKDLSFQGFHFNIVNTEDSSSLVNFSLSWLSTGIVLIIMDALSFLNALLTLTQKKAIPA